MTERQAAAIFLPVARAQIAAHSAFAVAATAADAPVDRRNLAPVEEIGTKPK